MGFSRQDVCWCVGVLVWVLVCVSVGVLLCIDVCALETQPAEGDPPTNHADPASPGTEVGRW